MDISACVIRSHGTAFAVEPVSLAAPRDDEVLVRILGVGVCHTDLAVASGGLPFPMPAVLGHEGAGVVEQIGAGVTEVAPGDHVVLSFRTCGACRQCLAGDLAYCENFGPLNFAGCRADGSATIQQGATILGGNFFGQSSFATYGLANSNNVIKIGSDLPIEKLGPLGCGIQTGAGAIMRSMACPAGSSVLIIGGGSVGLAAVMGAVVQGCDTIILLEPHAARRQLALALGATHAYAPTDEPLPKTVMAIAPRGVDFVLDTTAIPALIESGVLCLASRGVCGLVGVPAQLGATAGGNMGFMVAGGRSIRGIMEGDSNPHIFIPELLALYRQGRFPFDRLITTYKMADINQAIADQHAGACVKAVLLTGDER
jgi:aryl-alcohol dehydrogenase